MRETKKYIQHKNVKIKKYFTKTSPVRKLIINNLSGIRDLNEKFLP